MKNILYIIDDRSNPQRFLKCIEKRKNKDLLNFYICPITVDNKAISRISSLLSGYGRIVSLPFIKEFHKNAFSHKDRFIKFLSDFSSGNGKDLINLRRYFTCPFDVFSLWWLSLVEEKSTVKTNSYHNLAKLITIVDFQHDYAIDEIYADIENEDLKKAVFKNKGQRKINIKSGFKNNTPVILMSHFIKALGYAVFFIIRKCILYIISRDGSAKRWAMLKKSKFLFVTYFPFADRKLLDKNIFKNNYLGPLQTSIERQYKNELSWIGMLQDNSGLNISTMRLARQVNGWGYSLFLPEELYIARNFIFDYGKTVNIWDLFQDEWVYSFFGTYLMGNLLYYHIFCNAVSEIKKEAVVIYPSELVAWENALNIACKKNKEVKTVGIQHSSVPLLILKYFHSADDLKEGNMVDSFPAPRYLATTGEIPMKILVSGGWPKERVFNIGAIRYHRLLKLLEKETDWNKRDKRVVVALSIVKEEAREILSILKETFRDKDICTFVIKPHPACPVNDIFKAMGIESADNKFKLEINDIPLEDLLLSSRAVLVASSAASLNGIACQCPVIIPRLSCMADMNPLSGINEELASYVTNSHELMETVRSIVDSSTSPVEFDKSRAFINNYFTLMNGEDEYFRRLAREVRK